MKNKTFHSVISASVALFGLFASQVALAYVPGVWDVDAPRVMNSSSPFVEISSPATPTTTNQSQTTNTQSATKQTQTTSSTSQASVKKTTSVAKKTTTSAVAKKTADTASVDKNALTASAGKSSQNFMPDTIIEWLLVIFLIAIIVILSRKFTKKPASQTLAHAH